MDHSDLDLTDLPPEIANLERLQRLDLDNNQLTALPPAITSLKSLRDLYLGGNQINALPPEIAGIASLRWLELLGNQLTALPPEVASLKSLLWLDLDNNQLTALPPEITSLEGLQDLRLNRNPLPRQYFKALKDGIGNLFSLLDGLGDEAETAPIHEAKLLVIGEGDVGKTWALAALRGDDPRREVGERNTTWGIDRGALPLPHPEAAAVTLQFNTWDFGG